MTSVSRGSEAKGKRFVHVRVDKDFGNPRSFDSLLMTQNATHEEVVAGRVAHGVQALGSAGARDDREGGRLWCHVRQVADAAHRVLLVIDAS